MAALVVIRAVAPLSASTVFMMKVMCFALFACAFSLLLGWRPAVVRARHVSWACAGYVSAFRPRSGASRPSWPMLVRHALRGGAGLGGTGLLAIRRRGICFAMITLALAQMVFFFSLQAPFTGGGDGIRRRAARQTVRPDRPVAADGHVRLRAGGLPGRLPADLPHRALAFGQVLKAIRENEPRAVSLGYDRQFKHRAFVLSAALAGPGQRHQGHRVPAGPR